MMKRLLTIFSMLSLLILAQAQTYQKGYHQGMINPALLSSYWPACWISTPASEGKYEVSHFRKSFIINTKPEHFVIHLSADNRYKMYVNGNLVSLGPARCDIFNWNFETVDIAPYLQSGKNVLAAEVWNFAELAPAAQVSYGKTELIVQGNTEAEKVVNTDESWLCAIDTAYSLCTSGKVVGYYVAGPGETIDGRKYPWGWEQSNYSDAYWAKAKTGSHGATKGTRDYTGRLLVPSPIPQMDMHQIRFAGKSRMEIPAHSKMHFLLDNKELATGYLSLLYSKGKDAGISIGYAESLYEADSLSKGNRNETVDKIFLGYRDSIIADGGANRSFTPLWWRTWRYVELCIETRDKPLIIDDVYGTTSFYPFKRASQFVAKGNDDLRKNFDIGWRTARLCANETYMDCPYYEQMQYFGDTRIQAMVTLYNTHDTMMVKRALELGRQSLSPDGITMSRYPSAMPQFIPPYALSWIGMVYDYWMMRGDDNYVKTQLPAVRSIISWFEQWLMRDGSLGNVPYWNFADWAKEFKQGESHKDSKGHSAFQDLELLKALQEAADLERSLGFPSLAEYYCDLGSGITKNFRKKYYVTNKKMFADNMDRNSFSQHVNVLAILTGLVKGEEAKQLFHVLNSESTIAQCTIYYRYYLNQAMAKAGLGDEFLNSLNTWKNQISLGLSTWAESPEPSRSDCHAWGASPCVEFLRIILGVRSAAPGFSKVEIKPSLGNLETVSGSVPHPNGDIIVSYHRDGEKLIADISLPHGVIWRFNLERKNISAKIW